MPRSESRARASRKKPEATLAPWTEPAAEVEARLATGSKGLTAKEAAKRKEHFGPNQLASAPKRSEIVRLLLQFHNVLIYVLIVAAVLALAIGHTVDAVVILAVVLVNALVGYAQEGRAERALDAIRGMIDPQASVIRDGRRLYVAAEDIVPGDLVLLEPGDRVPADLRLLRVRNLRIDEAALSGESVPTDKGVAPIAQEALLGDRSSMAYLGTFVASGSGTGIVVATGAATEFGQISTLVGSIEPLATPLIRQMNALARTLTAIILALSMAVFVFAVLVRGYQWPEAFMVMIGVIVAAIPEGLPAVMTITLAIGVQRMAERNAIVRHLPAVETLGSVSVICSDKTGTLTRNEMTVCAVVTSEGAFEVTGVGYRPKGSFEKKGRVVEPATHKILAETARAAILCNDAELHQDAGAWHVHGDPMEGALVSLGLKAGHDADALRKSYPRTDEIPFDTAHKFMATLHHGHEGARAFAYIKGAPERLLAMCRSERTREGEAPIDKDFWRAETEAIARQGQRVLALAVKEMSYGKRDLELHDLTAGAILLGLVGLIDPPREEVRAASATAARQASASR